ncbi:hypothetical protein TrVE_jg10091 [Triparma verrucosa]|uniref:Nudix hydrolase domain-containing protein n=1 Tax=Triparma verrucosa TaxID=1606542 RepID=A0A9W7F862_9STRA|nr:hypothetical protein TrVE_jg10091 [Triparma verrucosa]
MAPFLLLQLKSLQLSLILLLLGFLPSPIKGVPPSTNPTGGFTFLSSTPLHIGKFRSLTSSLYSLPNNLTASYEIVTSTSPENPTVPAVTVLAYNTTSKKFTIIKEFYPSLGRLSFGTIAGLVDSRDSTSSSLTTIKSAARREAWEEAKIPETCDVDVDPVGRVMDKYVCTELYAALATFEGGGEGWKEELRDQEEQGMEIIEIGEEELLRIVEEGGFSVVGEWAVRRGLELWRKKYNN